MTRWIGISGTHGTGKSTVVQELKGQLMIRGKKVRVINSQTRGLMKALGLKNEKGSWELSLLCATNRFETELWYDHRLSQESGGIDYIISDRTMLDELAYAKVALSGVEGCRGIIESITRMTYRPVWDLVVIKRPDLRFEIEDDGVRPGGRNYQALIESTIDVASRGQRAHQLLKNGGTFVRNLPSEDNNEAVKHILSMLGE